jgi:V8-like Glu-specific endopeptidase
MYHLSGLTLNITALWHYVVSFAKLYLELHPPFTFLAALTIIIINPPFTFTFTFPAVVDAPPCGQRNNNDNARKRIIDGTMSNANEWPFITHLRVKANGNGYQQCGGSLIHPEWVLSAAHCVEFRLVR